MKAEVWYFHKDRLFEVNKYFIIRHFPPKNDNTKCCASGNSYLAHPVLRAHRSITVTHNACGHCRSRTNQNARDLRHITKKDNLMFHKRFSMKTIPILRLIRQNLYSILNKICLKTIP